MAPIRTITVVGNPNSGKTTLFNNLTGSTQRIGNWPGVTVEKKEGVVIIDAQPVTLVDLPGIYTLSAQSEDERVARDYILSGEPDLVINILDSTNIERNLYLTTQLLEIGVRLLVVANMMDLAAKRNISIDLQLLETRLGCPVIGINSTDRTDVQKVVKAIVAAGKAPAVKTAAGASRFPIKYPAEIDAFVSDKAPRLEEAGAAFGANGIWMALKLLERDPWVTDKAVATGKLSYDTLESDIGKVEAALGMPADVAIADARYESIGRLIEGVVARGTAKKTVTDSIDGVVLHRVLGIPIFVLIMYLMFWVTINIGGAFIDFFDIFFGTIFVDGFGRLLAAAGSPEWLTTILAGGIGAGVQTLATFIPVVGAMFFVLSLLEDSGYMARAAFVMDRFLQWMGLPGKAFVPMLVGFGCSVPAIMATRTLESKKDRYMTIFMTPLMSCGARLPVYALFGAAFFGAAAMNMVFSIYLAGILVAVLTGFLLKGTLFKSGCSHFVMELPGYHAPRMRNILAYTWSRLSVFMLRTKVIIVAVTILSTMNSLGVDGSFGNENTPNSVLSRVGKAITPVFTPMGVEKDNWPATVGIFTGIFAKEAVVGTLNSLYSQIDRARGFDAADAGGDGAKGGKPSFDLLGGLGDAFASIPDSLSGVWRNLRDPLGLGVVGSDPEVVAEEAGADQRIYHVMKRYFSKGPLQAYAYMLFILIYFPCVAAVGAIIKEMGKGFGTLAICYLTVMGWIVATLFYQITIARQAVWIAVPLLLLAAIAAIFRWMGGRPAVAANFACDTTACSACPVRTGCKHG